MVLNLQRFPSSSPTFHPNSNLQKHKQSHIKKYLKFRPRNLSIRSLTQVSFDDIAEISHNKVLVAAAVSAVIGQFSKPFTSSFLYGKDFDLRSAFQAGGFPSTHSSAVLAAATSLGLERGFTDSIFGMAVVYAGLVMYDAQGVRREVGNHAKILNRILARTQVNSISSKEVDNVVNSQPGSLSSKDLESISNIVSEDRSPSVEKSATRLVISDERTPQKQKTSPGLDSIEESEAADQISTILKESIGHTEIEVIAGALLGLVVSLTVFNIL